jgi:hypothetical protein
MMSVNYGAFLDSVLNVPSATYRRTRNQFCPGAIVVTIKRKSLFAALAFALPMAALVSSPAMATTHRKPAHAVHRSVHHVSTHHTATHHKPKPAHVAVH